MYTGSNPAALRSREEIVSTFLDLLNSTPLEDISIKQLMNLTDLSRQTFYKIFDSKEEILEYYLDTIFENFIVTTQSHTVHNLCDAAKLFFAFFETYKHSLRLVIQNGKSCVLQRKCKEYLQQSTCIHYTLKDVHTLEEQDYATTFVISGMVAMLEQWVREDSLQTLSALDLAKLVCRITGTDTAEKERGHCTLNS